MVREARVSGLDRREVESPSPGDPFDDNDDAFLSAFDPRGRSQSKRSAKRNRRPDRANRRVKRAVDSSRALHERGERDTDPTKSVE